MRGMVFEMNNELLHTLAQLQVFLDGTAAVDFAVAAETRYDFIACTVRRFGYGRLKGANRSVVSIIVIRPGLGLCTAHWNATPRRAAS